MSLDQIIQELLSSIYTWLAGFFARVSDIFSQITGDKPVL